MATQFVKQPAGGTGPAQRPPATVVAPSAADTVKGGGSKMVSSKAYNGIGSDAVKSLAQAGQTLDKMADVVPVVPVATPDGGKGNLASEDPTPSKPNVIKQGSGTKPGRQEPVKGQTGGRANGGVLNVQNPLLQSKKGA
jgi:hypothetical protein